MHHQLINSTTRCFRLGLAALWLLGCSGTEEPGDGGAGGPSSSGGSPGIAGTASVAGTPGIAGTPGGAGTPSFGGTPNTGGTPGTAGTPSAAGATSTGGAAGTTSTGGKGGSAGSLSAGTSSGGAQAGSAGASAGAGTGGASGGAGGIGSGGKGGSGGTTGTAGTGGGGAGGPQFGTGKERSLGYLGCSMSQNVAEGYAKLGGKRLWPVMGAYGAQVVQRWTQEGGPWTASGGFDSGVQQYGQPTDVWIMLCIFSNMVTLDEAKQIIALARKHAPMAKLYITGQPLNTGTDCNLAGTGGAALTDRIAKQASEDTSLNVTYAGTFGPLTVAQRSDGCHANDAGQRFLGQQVIDKWGM